MSSDVAVGDLEPNTAKGKTRVDTTGHVERFMEVWYLQGELQSQSPKELKVGFLKQEALHMGLRSWIHMAVGGTLPACSQRET